MLTWQAWVVWAVLGPGLGVAVYLLSPGNPPIWLVLTFAAFASVAAAEAGLKFDQWRTTRRARGKGPS